MRAVSKFNSSGVAWHNLAATLGDLGRGAEAVKAMKEAFLRGVDGAQGGLVGFADRVFGDGVHDEDFGGAFLAGKAECAEGL